MAADRRLLAVVQLVSGVLAMAAVTGRAPCAWRSPRRGGSVQCTVHGVPGDCAWNMVQVLLLHLVAADR